MAFDHSLNFQCLLPCLIERRHGESGSGGLSLGFPSETDFSYSCHVRFRGGDMHGVDMQQSSKAPSLDMAKIKLKK